MVVRSFSSTKMKPKPLKICVVVCLIIAITVTVRGKVATSNDEAKLYPLLMPNVQPLIKETYLCTAFRMPKYDHEYIVIYRDQTLTVPRSFVNSPLGTRISQMHNDNNFGAVSTWWTSYICLSSLALGFNVKDEGDFFIFWVAGAIESDRCSVPNNIIFYDFVQFRYL
ncbi:hypothetical protein TNCV_426981 [Trichonephila clavipes]|nr:hypothetical protein TNCV_426981 [Trichonephila clavipes]